MITLIQETSSQDSGFSSGTTLAATLTGVQTGSLIVCWFSNDTGSSAVVSNVRDNVNNTNFNSIVNVTDTVNQQDTGGFYYQNSLAGDPTVTVTWGTACIAKGIWLAEIRGATISGTALAGQSGQFQNTPGTGTDGVTSLTDTPTAQPALVYGLSFHNVAAQVPTPGTGFTAGATGWNAGFYSGIAAKSESKRITATTAVAATFTAGANNAHTTVMAIFKEASGVTFDVAVFNSSGIFLT